MPHVEQYLPALPQDQQGQASQAPLQLLKCTECKVSHGFLLLTSFSFLMHNPQKCWPLVTPVRLARCDWWRTCQRCWHACSP